MSLAQRFRDYLPVKPGAEASVRETAEELGEYEDKDAAGLLLHGHEEISLRDDPAPPSPPRRTFTELARDGCYELIPSFLRRSDRPEKLSQTAFLDGTRGVASFFVMHQHLLQGWTRSIVLGYGYPGESSVLQLPFIRLVYSGGPMVMLFFAISGYSLSYGPLNARSAHSSPERMLASVSSSVFRRALRLYLPPLLVSFLFMHVVWFGACEPNRAFHAQLPAGPDRFPDLLPTYWEQVLAWVGMVRNMAFTFSWDSDFPIFDPHLWTIRTEFMSSLVLYLVMVCTARVKPFLRVFVVFLVLTYVCYWGRWELFTFIGGLLVAETDSIRNVFRKQQQELDTAESAGASPARSYTGRFASLRSFFAQPGSYFWTANFISALYLLSIPLEGSDKTALWSWLYWSIPEVWRHPSRHPLQQIAFWWAIGAFQLIWTCANCPPLRGVFTNRVAQYLGKVSYALYIVHGPLLYTVGDGTARIVQGWIGRETFSTMWTVIAVEYVVLFPCLFVAADIVWRLVDVKSVSFAKWVQSKFFV